MTVCAYQTSFRRLSWLLAAAAAYPAVACSHRPLPAVSPVTLAAAHSADGPFAAPDARASGRPGPRASQPTGLHPSDEHEPQGNADPDAWRRVRPPAGPVARLQLPRPVQATLANGMQVYSLERSALPLVQVTVVIKSGSAQDPAEAPGCAAMMADLLKMGTTSRSATQIAEALEMQGTSLEVRVDEDAIVLSAQVLRDNAEATLAVMADVLLHPRFAQNEIDRAKRLRRSSIEQLDTEPVHTARRVFREVIFGKHPYGHVPLGDADALAHIGRRTLQRFYRANVRPANVAAFVIGEINATRAQAAIAREFGNWRGPGGAQRAPSVPSALAPQVVFVPRREAPQSQLMVGSLGAARNTPDYEALVLCNAVLGGLFNSRLNMNLREDKGWTYGARSSFMFLRQRGAFFVSTGVRSDATFGALVEIIGEVTRLRQQDVTDQELQDAKNRYSLSLPAAFVSNEGIADMLGNLYLYDLPLDTYQTLPDRLNVISTADVRRVAEVYLQPRALSIVAVGDPEHARAALERLDRGAVLQRDAHGHARGRATPAP